MQLMGIPPSAVSTCSLYPILGGGIGPWRCACLPTSQALGRSASICGKAHRQLPFQPARLLRPRLSLAWPPPLAPLRLRCLRLRLRLLPRLDRRRIPRDVLHQMAIHRPRNQRLMQTAGQTALGKLGKGPRKRRLRSEAGRHRSSRTAAIACRQPQDARSGRASSERRTRPWL